VRDFAHAEYGEIVRVGKIARETEQDHDDENAILPTLRRFE
jgi:hypothetical protein